MYKTILLVKKTQLCESYIPSKSSYLYLYLLPIVVNYSFEIATTKSVIQVTARERERQ